jgi:uncharacterized membrane protein
MQTPRKDAVNITEAERVVSAVAGGILAWAGLRKKSSAGVALALAGGELLRRGITGHCYAFELLGVRTVPEQGIRDDAHADWEVDNASEESFPASDAPSFTR